MEHLNKNKEVLVKEIVEGVGEEVVAKTSYNGAQLLRMKVTEIPSLVEPIFPKVGLVALIGTSDLGKSYFLLQLCIDVVLNEEFLGFKINATHKSAIYVSTEDDESSISYRLQRLQGCDEEKLKKLDFIFTSDSLIADIEAKLKVQKADVVVVDTFSDVYPGEMNQINKVRFFMNDFQKIAVKYKCLIVFNHHTGKYAEEKYPNKSNSIGSAGFEGKCRMVIEFRKDFNDESKRHMCIVKGNYLRAEYKSSSYELEFDLTKGFTPTGKRGDFSSLVKPRFFSHERNKSAVKELAIKLKKDGKSLRAIAEDLKKEGYDACKSSVAEWTKEVSVQKDVKESLDSGQGNSLIELSVQQTPKENLDTGQLQGKLAIETVRKIA